MDHFTDPLQPAPLLKPARRRLQKSDKRSFFSKRSSQDSNASSLSIESGLRSVTRQMSAVAHPSLPVSPDLGNAKWREYVEQHGLFSSGAPREQTALPPTPFPEFSHLAVSASPRSPEAPPVRKSIVSRRQAKTPVFKIGQLESSRREVEPPKPCSVDLIAESYRALLESGDTDTESIYTTAPSDQSSSPSGSSYEYHARHDSNGSRGVTVELPPLNPYALSPTSDDGTLVSFEEDAIYFKPISFSPESSPPAHRQSFEQSVMPVRDTGLDKCMDLLARELSTTGRRNDASGLQIWVMIEAYERLHEQMAGLGLDEAEMRNVRGVFDSWLGVLYKVHQSLAGDAAASDSDYEGLEEDVD